MSDQGTLDYLKKLVLDQQTEIAELNKKVKAALKQAEAAENYSRQDCLIFRGKLDVRPGHSLRDEMMRLIEHHTGVRFQPWCMNTVHWLGDRRSVIIRFNNKTVRDLIYRNRVPKDPAKRGLFVHESLTSTKVELVGRCARLRSEGKIVTYFTQGGSVFVKKTRDQPSILVSPDMSDANIIHLLENQPTSYRQAASRPPAGSGTTEVIEHPVTGGAPVGVGPSVVSGSHLKDGPSVTNEPLVTGGPPMVSGAPEVDGPPEVCGPSVGDQTSVVEGSPAMTGPSMGGGSPADGVPSTEDGCSATGMPSSVNKPVEPSTVQHDRRCDEANEQGAHGEGEKKMQKAKQQTAGMGKNPAKKGKGEKREPQKDNIDSGTSSSSSDSDERSDGDHGGTNHSDVDTPRKVNKDGGKIQQNKPPRKMKTRRKK